MRDPDYLERGDYELPHDAGDPFYHAGDSDKTREILAAWRRDAPRDQVVVLPAGATFVHLCPRAASRGT